MEKLIIAIALVFSGFTAQAQVSKVNEFINSLSKNQKEIKIFRFNSENIKDVAKLKDGDLFFDIKPMLSDSVLMNLQDLVICQIGTEQANESKSLENVIKKADLKTLYAIEQEGVLVQMLTSNIEDDVNMEDLLIDVKSYDNSRMTVMLMGKSLREFTSKGK